MNPAQHTSTCCPVACLIGVDLVGCHRPVCSDLHFKIIEIKKKADASEQMVQEICRDIRQLDVAQKHLTDTINALARLQTL